MTVSVDVVVPTVGRDSLALLLASLDGPPAYLPNRVILVDDRRAPCAPLPMGALSPELAARLEVVAGGGRGRAAARNLGWQAARADWVAFLADDVLPCRGWHTELRRDLEALPANCAGSQGRIRVPLPTDRLPTDRERTVRRLESAPLASADVAYRTSVLRRLGGFDERFARPNREDADLALRVRAAGLHVATGRRTVVHPVWPTTPWASVWSQADNADDALMRALHGGAWRDHAAAPADALRGHVAITTAGVLAVAGGALGVPLVAAGGLVAWLGGTAAFAWRRIAPGPRTPGEVVTMLATSAAIPGAAVWHRLVGELRALGARRRPEGPSVTIDAPRVQGVARRRTAGAVRPLAGASRCAPPAHVPTS